MADQPPAHPLANPYGGRGPLILSLSWTEALIALVLMLMRTYTNAFVVKSFKWDYFWAILTLVGISSAFKDFKNMMNDAGHRHDRPGYFNSSCLFGTRQSYVPSDSAANSKGSGMGLDRPMLAHSIHRFWEICSHCLHSANPRSSANPEDYFYSLLPLLHWRLKLFHQHYRNDYGPYFLLACRQILELGAPGKLQPCSPH